MRGIARTGRGGLQTGTKQFAAATDVLIKEMCSETYEKSMLLTNGEQNVLSWLYDLAVWLT